MQLKIQYYALMREQAGRSEETVETSAATPADLYSELAARYGFTLMPRAVESGGQQRVQRLVAPLAAPTTPSSSFRRWRAADALPLHSIRHRHRSARRELLDLGAGGYVSFEGWVRDHNEGHEVTRLEYEAFQELAVKEGERIIAEALRRFPVKHALCIHRSASLDVERHGSVGRGEFRAPRRSLRCLPIHHR